MIGAAAAMQRDEHTILDYFVNLSRPARARARHRLHQRSGHRLLFVYLIKLSFVLVPNAQLQTSAGLGLPLGYVFAGHSDRLSPHHPAHAPQHLSLP